VVGALGRYTTFEAHELPGFGVEGERDRVDGKAVDEARRCHHDLVEGGFDLAIRIGTLGDSSLIAQRIGTSRSVLVAHPDYLARAGTPKAPGDLAEHAVLVFSLSETRSRWTLTRGTKSETVRVRGPLQANSSLALQTVVRQGLGVARMPLFVVGEELSRGVLVEVLPDWESTELGIHVVTTARDHMPRKTRAFIDFFKERLGDPPPWERGRVWPPSAGKRAGGPRRRA
jgi:DNA-binding transcriptional LysR family regulator